MKAAVRKRPRKQSVNLSLSSEIVREARKLTDNLSSEVEVLLAEFVRRKMAEHEARRALNERAARQLGEFTEKYGSLADEFSTL